MHSELDPVDGALQSLRSARFGHGVHEKQLEETLMREFGSNSKSSRFAKYRTLVVSLIVVALGGVGFAAGGGTGLVKKWFITVDLIGEDGAVFTGTLESIEGEAGFVPIEIVGEDGETTTIQVQRVGATTLTGEDGLQIKGDLTFEQAMSGEIAPGDAKTLVMQIDASVDGDGDGGGTVSVQMERLGGDSAVASSSAGAAAIRLVPEIVDPEESLSWVGDDGASHELSVVRNVGEVPGFTVFTTINRDGELPMYLQVGAIETENPKAFSVDDIVITDDGFGLVTLINEDGSLIDLKVNNVEAVSRQLNIRSVGQGVQRKTLRKIERPE